MSDLSLADEVQQLYSRYCFGLDDGDHDGWARLFAPTGRFIGPGRPVLTGFNELTAFARSRTNFASIKHLTFNTLMGAQDGQLIACAADFVILQVDDEKTGARMTATGRYADLLTRIDGELLFAERIVNRIL